MQLDVEVSPPANGVQKSNLQIHKSVKVITYKAWLLRLTKHIAENAGQIMMFEITTGWGKPWRICAVLFLALTQGVSCNRTIPLEPLSLNSGPVNYFLVWILVRWIMVQSRTDRQKVMHKSPPCISTGVLKNQWPFLFFPPHYWKHIYSSANRIAEWWYNQTWAEAFSMLEAEALTHFSLEAEALVKKPKPKPGYLYSTKKIGCKLKPLKITKTGSQKSRKPKPKPWP